MISLYDSRLYGFDPALLPCLSFAPRFRRASRGLKFIQKHTTRPSCHRFLPRAEVHYIGIVTGVKSKLAPLNRLIVRRRSEGATRGRREYNAAQPSTELTGRARQVRKMSEGKRILLIRRESKVGGDHGGSSEHGGSRRNLTGTRRIQSESTPNPEQTYPDWGRNRL